MARRRSSRRRGRSAGSSALCTCAGGCMGSHREGRVLELDRSCGFATAVIAFAFALAALALCERGSRVICFPLPSSRRGTRPTDCRVDRRGRLPAVVIGRAVIFVLQPVGSPTGWVKGAARCFPRQHFRPLAPRYRAESTLLPWIGTVASGHNCVSGCHEFVTTTPVCTYAPAGARLPLRSHRILFVIYRCHVRGCHWPTGD